MENDGPTMACGCPLEHNATTTMEMCTACRERARQEDLRGPPPWDARTQARIERLRRRGRR